VADLGTELHRVVVDAPDIAGLLPEAVVLSEKPTLRTALAPLLRLSAAVNDAVNKVAEASQQKLGSVGSGMNLPPGFKMPF